MQLLNQNGQNKCLIYSLAMLLDKSVEEIEASLPKVNNRSHDIQEIIDFLYPDYSLLRIVPMPAKDSPTNHVYTPTQAEIRFQYYLNQGSGIITCHYAGQKGMHAVAWDGKSIYDPNGRISSINSPMYEYHEFFLLIRLK